MTAVRIGFQKEIGGQELARYVETAAETAARSLPGYVAETDRNYNPLAGLLGEDGPDFFQSKGIRRISLRPEPSWLERSRLGWVFWPMDNYFTFDIELGKPHAALESVYGIWEMTPYPRGDNNKKSFKKHQRAFQAFVDELGRQLGYGRME